MKVLFFNYEYPPLGGGASIATEALLGAWREDADMEVHLITSGTGKSYERIDFGGSVFVHRLPIGKDGTKLHSQSVRDILVYSWRAWRFSRALVAQEAKRQPFDITLAFFTVPCGFLAYLIERQFGIPFVVSLRGADVPGFSEKYNTFYLFAKPLIRFLWRRARAVIPNSLGIRALAHQTSPGQAMTIIENGVDTVLFSPSAEPKKSAPVVFLSTSRLTARKGIGCLIEAFALALKTSPTALELRLIGEGEERALLEARVRELGISEQVVFLGRMEHAQLAAAYRQAQVFVLPSKNEGMSNAALEALACGLPLVVSGTGGMQELVTDGKNGHFIDPEERVVFAGVLASLAASPEQRDSFGKESRRLAQARGWHQVAAQFKTVLLSQAGWRSAKK
jgi:glycosyltransferase involved in cell wall biosynthesis